MYTNPVRWEIRARAASCYPVDRGVSHLQYCTRVTSDALKVLSCVASAFFFFYLVQVGATKATALLHQLRAANRHWSSGFGAKLTAASGRLSSQSSPCLCGAVYADFTEIMKAREVCRPRLLFIEIQFRFEIMAARTNASQTPLLMR